MGNTNNLKKIEKDLEIKREITKLKSLFKDMEKKYSKATLNTIENAAFMAVTLRELREKINQEGLTVEYQNGENQFGIKKSPEVDIYNTMVKNFMAAMKQLTDLMPKGSGINDDDFDDFIGKK